MPSATIKLFLPHGEARRLRTAEISNWSGKALAAPRTEFEDLLAREELGQSGVYFLTGTDPDTNRPRAYIGEAEVLRDRLKMHRAKEFWVSVMVFVSKDENLTKSHIRHLEGRLLAEAREVGRVELDNNAATTSRLPEADRHDMEVFLEKIRLILPVLGSDLLTPLLSAPRTDAQRILTTSIKGLTASGRRTETGFVVLKGSQAVPEVRKTVHSYAPALIAQRQVLLDEGKLALDGDHLTFTTDTEFSSPSTAGRIVHGGNVNGLVIWKDPKGRTLKEIEGA